MVYVIEMGLGYSFVFLYSFEYTIQPLQMLWAQSLDIDIAFLYLHIVLPFLCYPSCIQVVCYFTNWAWYRPGAGKYTPDNIDASLCTHVVYGFAVLHNTEYVIRAHDSWADFDNGKQFLVKFCRQLKSILLYT